MGINLAGSKKSTKHVPLVVHCFLYHFLEGLIAAARGSSVYVAKGGGGGGIKNQIITFVLNAYDTIVDTFRKCVNKVEYTYDDLIIETEENLGDVEVVNLGINGRKKSQEFVDYTKVYDFSKSRKESEFPCYHWIQGDHDVSTTSATSKEKSYRYPTYVVAKCSQNIWCSNGSVTQWV
jgi:hypothetical protein